MNTDINVETLILVAVWEHPFIFQGCFKISELHGDNSVLFFFRCQSNQLNQQSILQDDFAPDDYEFTHLYNELGVLHTTHEDALYLLKYALHVTLREMLSSTNQRFTHIDDVAMRAMIDKITPILNEELVFPEEEHIGFAVAMDFCPKEETGKLAALALLKAAPLLS